MSGRLRGMTTTDLGAVARLHAASWRATYTSVLSAGFLQGPVEAERSAVWAARAHELDNGSSFGLVTEDGSDLTGFAWVILAADPVHGHLIDNVHVAPGRHGMGLGRRLMAGIAEELVQRAASGGVYLWVYAANERAQGFYERCGGLRLEATERASAEGRPTAAYRYGWTSPAALRAAIVGHASGRQGDG